MVVMVKGSDSCHGKSILMVFMEKGPVEGPSSPVLHLDWGWVGGWVGALTFGPHVGQGNP